MPPDLPLRRNREFVALWVGQAGSALGTSISSLAYPLLLLAVTGSPAIAGAVAAVLAGTTFVLRIPAGVVADRLDRKRLMLLCDGGRLLAVGSLGLAVVLDELHLAHVFFVAVVEGALGVLFAPAEQAAVRAVVAPTQLRDAIATNQARQQVAGLVGPSLGGALFGLGRGVPFLADALSYAVSFLAVLTIRTPLPAGRRSHPEQRLRHELGEGLRWLWQQPYLRYVVVWLAGAGLLFSSLGIVTVVIAQQLDATPAQIGITFTIAGAGGLAGALAAPSLLRRAAPALIVTSFAWTSTAAVFSLLLVESVYLLGLVTAAANFLVPAVIALVMTEVAERAPEAILGRANSATVQILTLFNPAAPAVAGVALQTLGTNTTVVSYGLAFALLAIIMTTSTLVRTRSAD